jgi:hypothetical protein
MTFSDWITLIGTVVTIVGMLVAIGQARSALRSSKVAKSAMTAVQLAAVAERLKSAQEHIRDVAPDKVSQRGFKVGNRIDLIRRAFDGALSVLPRAGMGSEARTQLTKAQSDLNNYQASLSEIPDPEMWQKLQVSVQDSVSDLTSTATKLGEKK